MSFNLKSFDDFDKIKPKQINESVIDEGLFSRRNKGKQVLISPSGKKHKVIWKDQGNGNFMVKLVNDLDIISSNSRLTAEGQSSLINFLNKEASFAPKWDPVFFTNNFIVYTIKRDNARVQKIQFSNKVRSEFTDVDTTNINFMSSEELKDANVVKTQQNLLNTTKTEEPVDTSTTNKDEVISDDYEGKSFKHMFNTIKQECTFSITANGGFHFEGITNDTAFGTINYVQGKVIAIPEPGSNMPELTALKEVTDVEDIQFLRRAFTDSAYLKSLIDASTETEEVEFNGTFDADNIKRYLYDHTSHALFPANS